VKELIRQKAVRASKPASADLLNDHADDVSADSWLFLVPGSKGHFPTSKGVEACGMWILPLVVNGPAHSGLGSW
jgi:hypothetical protein